MGRRYSSAPAPSLCDVTFISGLWGRGRASRVLLLLLLLAFHVNLTAGAVRIEPFARAAGAMKHLPYFCRGEVVRGFGRGSKELGIPTANFSEDTVESFPSDIPTGIYFGWASVANGEDVHKMVLSIGWNPYYKNVKKSVETHVIHSFKEDFYGEILSIIIVGYIRPEKNFDSLSALIAAIQSDIEEAKRNLDLPEHQKYKDDSFFHMPESKMVNGH